MTDIKDQRSYYVSRWASFKQANSLDLQRITKVLEYLCDVPIRDNICDLGCGAGWTTSILGHFGRSLGVELSDVERQRERFGHCEFISADALQWDHPDAVFDAVVTIEVIEHIPYSMQPSFLRVAYCLLKPGGFLILTTPNKRTMEAMLDPSAWSNQPVEDWLDMAELVGLLEQNGFEVLRKSSLILGHGRRGIYRLANSYKVATAVKFLGLEKHWNSLLLALNYGLHLTVLARKK